MIEIKDLLLKFSNILLSEESKTESIKNILERVLELKIKNKDIKIKNNTVYLNIKPIFKNEILIKRGEIDFLLEKALDKKAPKNIR